jgi:DNA primase
MPANKLKEFFAAGRETKRAPQNRPEPTPKRQGRMSSGRGNLLTQAITLVLHHPAAAGAIEDPELLASIDKPGVSVLKELLEQAASASAPSTATLLERWRERPEFERLTELAMQDPLVADAPSAAKELAMAVEKLLQEYGPGRRMDELLKKAEELGLNYDEKAELSNLLKSKGRFRAPH